MWFIIKRFYRKRLVFRGYRIGYFLIEKISSINENVINVSQKSQFMKEKLQRETGECFECWRRKNILVLDLLWELKAEMM